MSVRSLVLSLGTIAFLAIAPAAKADQYKLYAGELSLQITGTTYSEDFTVAHIDATVAGFGTVIGNFTGTVTYDVNLLDGTFIGIARKTSANGGTLYEVVLGQLSPDFSTSQGVGIPYGGTGRFRKAHGFAFFETQFTSATTGELQFLGLISLK